MSRTFLVRIETDLRIRKLVWMPVTLESEDGIAVFYKSAVLCDACNTAVNTGKEDEETLPPGYVLCEEGSLIEVVCEDCRRRYFPKLPVYDELEEAERR